MFDENIDIHENYLKYYCPNILKILLKDRTTKKNIIWATNDYFEKYFNGYEPYKEIFVDSISGLFGNIIQPRISKALVKQIERTKIKAEVFTPSWICNKQNNLIDSIWFGRKEVFNIEEGTSWKTIANKIDFPDKNKSWKDYIELNRLEISCGEAPYLVSRYDNATGKIIQLKDRVGLLDRKLRVVCENALSKDEWIDWSIRAVQSIYGYEYQGDNVLIARENILYTYIDYYKEYFKEEPEEKLLLEIAKVISWNIWQMDGLTNRPPYFFVKESSGKLRLIQVVETVGIEPMTYTLRTYRSPN